VDAGSRVDVGILRNGSDKTVSVEIGAFKVAGLAKHEPASKSAASSEKLGATLATLTEDVRNSLGLSENVSGALVTSLKAGGAASEAGLRVGDVIVKVGSTEVSDPSDLDAALAGTDTKSALLMVNRRGDPFFVGVKLGA
jgi:serine protease Do